MSVYLGPFVKVKVAVIEQHHNQHWCPKCDKRRGNTAFCQNCGDKIIIKPTHLVNEPKYHWTIPATCVLRYAVTEGNPDRGTGFVHYIYTIGNGRTDFNERQEDEGRLKKYWLGWGGGYSHWNGATDLQGEDPQDHIKFLKYRCAGEIENICEVFGEENVTFGWGIVY